MRTLLSCGVVLVLMCSMATCSVGSPTEWSGRLYVGGSQGLFIFGAMPGTADGYDGLPTYDWTARESVYVELYRANGPNWTGPTGFYAGDYESPIPDGGSHTWSDVYLWSYNYALSTPDRALIGYTWGTKPPAGYTGILTLDYVPVSLNWTGPTEFRFDLTKTMGYYLPCPITDDPFNPENVTRMHLTVYTTPEPSSLAALGLALAGLGAGVVRRRRR